MSGAPHSFVLGSRLQPGKRIIGGEGMRVQGYLYEQRPQLSQLRELLLQYDRQPMRPELPRLAG
jgi:hypothetical protein